MSGSSLPLVLALGLSLVLSSLPGCGGAGGEDPGTAAAAGEEAGPEPIPVPPDPSGATASTEPHEEVAEEGRDEPLVPPPGAAPPPEPTFTPEDETTLSPEETLAAWIAAQEAGDSGWALRYVVESQHEAAAAAMDQLASEDLVASGLQFREEDYRLDFRDDHLAIFWSSVAHLYLVMVKDGDGRWKLDPSRTDEMNAEAEGARDDAGTPPAGLSPTPPER